jgi:prepilin-type N-terminal cleavage/methylation domain-containing protein
MKAYSKQVGFTLAEVLIVMAILGVIATFTVPKVLYSSNQASWNAKAKEAAAAISEAYTVYRMEKGVSANTSTTDILAYINSVGPYTGTINEVPGYASLPCTGVNTCIQLHNGAVILVNNTSTFNGTTPNHSLYFHIDPDGKNTDGGTSTPANGSVLFWLYANGGLRTFGTLLSPTLGAWGSTAYSYGPTPSADPTWFSWN